jgi:hypothetical protein
VVAVTDFLWLVLFVLAWALLLVTATAVTVGLVGACTGERPGRCPRCHRFGWTVEGQVHGGGCPDPGHLQPMAAWWHEHHVRLRHH